VWVPFDLAARLLARLTGVEVSAGGIWSGVQARGCPAIVQLDKELARLAAGEPPAPEVLAAEVAALPLMLRYRSMGADGVKVPFRPHGGHPGGAIAWREVKVGVLARFSQRVQESGKPVFTLKQRRGVAGLGDIEALKPRLWLEALRQSIEQAEHVNNFETRGVKN
jgi:hypothetical protein